MSSIQFIVNSQKNPTKIGIRFYISRANAPCIRTEILINGKMWSNKKKRLKGADEYSRKINNKLEALKAFICNQYSLDYSEGKIINRAWLKETVSTFFNRPKDSGLSFSEEIIAFVKKNPLIKGKKLSKGTLDNYLQIARIVKKYKDVHPFEIDLNFHSGFLKYLKKNEYAPNTINKFFTLLKAALSKLEVEGVTINPDIRSALFYKPPSIEIDTIYLNENQIQAIKQVQLNETELILARDNFLLGLRTGLRVSDFLKLQNYNIKENYLHVQTKKTDKRVIIPIHQDVAEILKKNNGLPENLSDQKFNKHVKVICKKAGLDKIVYGAKVSIEDGKKRKRFGKFPFYELVSSHICRRSFATNLYGKLSNLTIMQITGHKTETSFLRYIKISSLEHAEKLKKFWES